MEAALGCLVEHVNVHIRDLRELVVYGAANPKKKPYPREGAESRVVASREDLWIGTVDVV